MPYELFFLFFARMADMSAATLRQLFVVRGHRLGAAIIGFVEIVIYMLALGLMLQGPHSAVRVLVFGLGYATGIFVGSLIEEKLAMGSRLLQITVEGSGAEIIAMLRKGGCPVTTWQGEGLAGEKRILQVLVPRRQAAKLLERVRRRDPDAFIVALEPRAFLGGFGAPVVSLTGADGLSLTPVGRS